VAKTYAPPYPDWFKPNEHCDYHHGVAGHSAKYCYVLKLKVQDLIREERLSFSQNAKPNVGQNPLPNHGGAVVNAINDEELDQLDNLIYAAEVGSELDNWSVVEISAIFSSSEEM